MHLRNSNQRLASKPLALDYGQLTQYFNHVSFRVERMQRNTFMRHHGAKWAAEQHAQYVGTCAQKVWDSVPPFIHVP